jgi:cytochrome P450
MTQTQPKLPPGPSGRLTAPLRFLDYARDPLGYLTRMARKYGDVVLFANGPMPFFMFSHPDQIEEILRREHRVFKKDVYMEALRPLLGNGLLSSEGEEWRRARAMAQPAFQAKQIQQYAATMVEYTERMIAGWTPGETRNVHADMMRLTSQIVTKTLFDADVEDAEGSIGKNLEAAMMFYANPLSMFPKWRHVPTPTNLRFRRTLRLLDELIFTMIRERRAEGPGDRSDLLSRLLSAQDEQGRKMSDTELRDELLTLFLAGHETTALTLTYTFYLLATNSDCEADLHAEIDRVLGERPPEVADVPALGYAENVIKESMRLYPPAWTTGREATEDVQIGDYLLKKGTNVLMAQWVVHRDPRFWPEADRFLPGRWDDEQTKQLPRCAYFPFGDGPRVCIGNNFAMMEAVLLMTTIAQRFRLELVPGQTLRLVPSVTMRPRDGVKVVVRKRSARSGTAQSDRTSAQAQYAAS